MNQDGDSEPVVTNWDPIGMLKALITPVQSGDEDTEVDGENKQSKSYKPRNI